MTETTQRIAPAGRSPEFHHAVGLLRGLREDLVQDALAYRPLPPTPPDGPLTRRLPERIRRRLLWVPHLVVAAAALLVLAAGYGTTGFLPTALVPAVPVLLTLVRPVAAFWASLLATSAYAVVAGGWGVWSPATFLSHLVVVTVVAARTRPRAAAWMWVVTGVYGLSAGTVLGNGDDGDATAQLLFAAALALLVVTVWHVRRAAREEVTAQRTATAQERSMRTLLEERTTIARELHDVVAHHMSVVAIQAEAAPYRVENPPPELEQAFLTIRENAVAALAELRRVLGVVRAEDYEAPDAPQPTLADLDGLIANVRDAGLDVDKAVTGAVRELPQGVELSAYRIVQEALSNVLRHAPGAAARVEVGYVLGGLGLRVVNGPPRGPVKPSPGAGHGIAGMRERVAMLDGELTAGATDDGGYEVAVFVPVARDGAA
ncbi:histidine kinase [Streptomyces somaliensis]|uniref:sensor histidine kinase n=1 Tax=Streptomyces somaliensis TaxID=78355 RepID=UPI0020CD3251|nr:histidine kinase [Streptomyces somaliensis]MCP9945302.1 histidine kinase [Streptomyces somaliensis]MCP9961493.1 histidine kinase [Streptomyces somaliensis]MCP9974302.1 histidine kinase [Streptomyces somaliensis]